MTDPPLLQVCPNDRPPFLDICAVYQAAAASLGRQLTTVFLTPASARPLADAVYLDCPDLRRTRTVAAALESALATRAVSPPAALAICHRYRAYRVLRVSRYAASPTVAVAHEFGFFARRRRRVERRLFASKVRFAGVSQPVVDELAAVVEAPVLLPNAMDLRRARAQRLERAAALAALNLRAEDFNIGVIGRLHPKKQPQLALAGFAIAAGALPDARLVFIGDGELREELRSAAGALPVAFPGFVPEAARHVRALDVLVIPSGEREAFSMVALEAMAAGVPVIAGPTPGPHFVLGEVGYYFTRFAAEDLAASLQRVHAERGRDADRLARGVRRAEQEFSVAALAQRLAALLGGG